VEELQEKGDKAYILSDWVKETKCCLEVSGMKDWNEVLVKGGNKRRCEDEKVRRCDLM